MGDFHPISRHPDGRVRKNHYMESILVPLYGACGVLSAILYLPLLHRLVTQEEAWRGHSLASWSGWFAISLVNLAYATMVNGDAKFILAASAGCLSLLAVVGTIVFKTIDNAVRRRRSCLAPGLHMMIPSEDLEIPLADNDTMDSAAHAIVA